MTFLLACLGGAAGAALGFLAGIVIGTPLLEMTGVSAMNGGSAMAAFATIAPIGTLIGLVVGVALTLRWRGVRSSRHALGYSALALVTIAALGAGIMVWLQATNEILRPNQLPLQLDFEVRLPLGVAVPERLNAVKIELQTDKNTMPGQLFDRLTRKDGERNVVGGRVDVYFRTSNRALALIMPAGQERVFWLKLAASPAVSATYSQWTPADAISDKQPAQTSSEQKFEIRYRIVDPVVGK